MNSVTLIILVIGGIIVSLILGGTIMILIYELIDYFKKKKIKKEIPLDKELLKSFTEAPKTIKEVNEDARYQATQYRLHERIRQLAEAERTTNPNKPANAEGNGFYERSFGDARGEQVSPISNQSVSGPQYNNEGSNRDNKETFKLTRPAEI